MLFIEPHPFVSRKKTTYQTERRRDGLVKKNDHVDVSRQSDLYSTFAL
jgi:hypothetical protein